MTKTSAREWAPTKRAKAALIPCLPFLSLLPRACARLWERLARGQEGRTHLPPRSFPLASDLSRSGRDRPSSLRLSLLACVRSAWHPPRTQFQCPYPLPVAAQVWGSELRHG